MRPLCLPFAALLFALSLLAAAPAFSQAAPPVPSDFSAALSGNSRPLSLTLKDLDGSWRMFTLSGSGDNPSQLQSYFALLTGGTQSTYYTKGETVTLSGEVYLIAYHQKNTVDYATLLKGSGSDNPPPAPKLTPDTVLSLSLLNLRLIGSLNDIQAFSLQAALNPPPPPAPDPIPASTSNLKQLGLALLQYTQDYDEVLPPMKNSEVTKAAIYPYVKSDAVFHEPPTDALYQPNTSLSHRHLASFNDPASMVTYYEPTPQSDGLRAILFLDGHVKRVADADWQRLRTASHIPVPPH